MKLSPITQESLIKVTNTLYEIPQTHDPRMRVPAHIYATEKLLSGIVHDKSLEQIAHVTTLPGIQKYALAMPDIHQGYGFPIGGVAATAIHAGGVISPGGIGYDINCGMRLMALDISAQDIKKYIQALGAEIFETVPSGVGRGGLINLSTHELNKVLENGAHEMIDRGIGEAQDLEFCEENGRMRTADPDAVSDRAKQRGHDQLGTLGSGNHFLEIQKIEKIFDAHAAEIFGLHQDMVVVMIHCGSRGLGHQVCTDYVRTIIPKLPEWHIELPDLELACAPFFSVEGQAYFSAMSAAANFAWANRHVIGDRVRAACKKIISPSIAVTTMYDLSHNIGKREVHTINGTDQELLVHRKGATRAFGAGRAEVPTAYRSVGHPVLIPGTMGTSSYILHGTQKGMIDAFGSSCHGAGRSLSRMAAKRTMRGETIRKQLEDRGISVFSTSDPGLAEEAPLAYKDVDEVVHVMTQSGLANMVAQVTPIAVIKGD